MKLVNEVIQVIKGILPKNSELFYPEIELPRKSEMVVFQSKQSGGPNCSKNIHLYRGWGGGGG